MTKFEKLLLKEAIRCHMLDDDDSSGGWEDAMDLLSYLQNGTGARACSERVRQYITEARPTVRAKRPVQQLKPAISLVRKWALEHRDLMDYTEFNCYLEYIEKRAGV